MNRDTIYKLAQACGINPTEQPDTSIDLDPRIYEFAEMVEGQALIEMATAKEFNSEQQPETHH